VSTRAAFIELVLCAAPRICERCGAWTYWKRPLQRSLGHCPDHTSSEGGPEYAQAFVELVRALRPVRIDDVEPERYAPGAYGAELVPLLVRGRWIKGGEPYRFTVHVTPQDAGPCARCQGRIRLYGPDSHPLCTDCEKTRD